VKVRDQRRAALLESLEDLLQESGLDSINIADISRRAGVTRSAFYFYFESKHLAVAALMEQVYDGALVATQRFADPDLAPADRVRGMVTTLFDTVEAHTHLFRAMLEARGQSAAVRDMWDADRQSFVDLVADLVRTERAAGRAPDGPDAGALAAMLLELNDRALERLTLGTLDRHTLEDAVVSIWVRSIFATDPILEAR
jgi:AcrR family transcriptional regulator